MADGKNANASSGANATVAGGTAKRAKSKQMPTEQDKGEILRQTISHLEHTAAFNKEQDAEISEFPCYFVSVCCNRALCI